MPDYRNNLNMNNLEIQNYRVQNLAGPPDNPLEGQEYYNTIDHRKYYFNGIGWIASDGIGATMTGTSIISAINANEDSEINLDKLENIATNTFLGRNTAEKGEVEVLSNADAKTMLGLHLTQTKNAVGFSVAGGTTSKTLTVENTLNLKGTDSSTLDIGAGGTLKSGAYADDYTHPTGDGNLHVPATSTTNEGKVLTAGATAGSLSWQTPSVKWANVDDKPTSAVADIDSAVSLKHSQNTDTGTSSSTFQIGTGGPKIKNSSGEIQLRNAADNDYADLKVKNLTVEGTTFSVKSEVIELADNQLLLNSNITTSAGNEDGGIAVKRLMADNTTRKDAELNYNTSTNRWETKQGAVTGTLVTATLANKVVATIGNGSLTSFAITHNLNTRDLVVCVRETGSPYQEVFTDVEFTDLTKITVRFAVAPTNNQYTVTIVG